MNVNIASSTPKHVHHDTSPNQPVNHNCVSLSPAIQLTNFNDDTLYQICCYLPLHETNVLARTCKRLDQVIDKGFLSSEGKSWFIRFGPVQQNQFRGIAKANNDDDLKEWLTTPGKEQAIFEQLIRRRKRNDLFAEVLCYTSSRLTAEADHFEAFSLLKVHSRVIQVSWTRFSPDGRFAVVMASKFFASNVSPLAVIYSPCQSRKAKGGWVEQLAIPCQDDRRKSLVFSPDNEHMAVAGVLNAIVIYRLDPAWSRGTGKLWCKLDTIRQTGKIEQITFNANGQYLATRCANGVTTILALTKEGKWLEEAVISLYFPIVSVTFADDGHRVLLGLQNKSGKIYDRNTIGKWVEHSGFEQCAPVFSGDGCHAIIYSCDGKARICSRGADGVWSNGIVIADRQQNDTARFSPDNKYLLIFQGNTIKIFGTEGPGIWAEQVVIELPARSIISAKFSSDSQHVLIDYEGRGYHCTIISRERSNAWSTTAVFHHATLVTFSCDSRHVLARGLVLESGEDETASLSDEWALVGRAYYKDRKCHCFFKMYSWKASREWSERTVVFQPDGDKDDKKVNAVDYTLSSDNRHLMISNIVAMQLWRLEPQTGEHRKTPMVSHSGGTRTLRRTIRSRTTPQV